MGGKPGLAHIGLVHKPTFHHEPPQKALQSTQYEDSRQMEPQPSSYPAFDKEENKRQQKNHADCPSPQPMEVFKPENAFEFREAHPLVDFPVFREFLVFPKNVPPFFLTKRRQKAGDRLPLHHGKAGMSQPRHAAQNNHYENHGATDEKPYSHGPVRSLVLRGRPRVFGSGGRALHNGKFSLPDI